MLFFYGIWMLCHHGQSPKKGEKLKQRFLGYNEKTHFPFVKSARKPRNVSFLTQNPRFLRIVGYPAASIHFSMVIVPPLGMLLLSWSPGSGSGRQGSEPRNGKDGRIKT